jgi:hypothetical protein
MPDTGAPWNLPYPAPTDLVRDGAQNFEDLADAVATGLSAAGGLVAVKSAIFAGEQSASVTGGNNLTVTDLTITHETADAANKLIISAFLGQAATTNGLGNVGIAVHDGSGLIGIGNAAGSRIRVTAGGFISPSSATFVVTMPSVTFVHTPGAGSKTYTVRAINIASATATLFINRAENDPDSADRSRAVSALVIQEVKV